MKRKRRRHVVWGIQLRITARSSRLVHGDLVDLVQTTQVDLVQLAINRTPNSANLILQLLLFLLRQSAFVVVLQDVGLVVLGNASSKFVRNHCEWVVG